MNKNSEYIDIQTGGLYNLFVFSSNKCSISYEKIAEYLNILDNKSEKKITTKNITDIYNYVFGTDESLDFNKEIKNSIRNLKQKNDMIHNNLQSKSKSNIETVPEILFSNHYDNNKVIEDYKTLCNLSKNYYDYIKLDALTDNYITLLCEMSIKNNYLVTVEGDGILNSIVLVLNSDNSELKIALEQLRLDIINKSITEFLNNFKEFMIILDENFPTDTTANSYKSYLISIAEKFNEKKKSVSANDNLLENYNVSINNYVENKYKSESKNIDFNKIFLEEKTEYGKKICKEYFPQIYDMIINENSSINIYFRLFNESNNKTVDLIKYEKIFSAIQMYSENPVKKEELYPVLREKGNIDKFLGNQDSLIRQIITYFQINRDDFDGEYFNKDKLTKAFKSYYDIFNLGENINILNPIYGIFPNIENKYPLFIKNLLNDKLNSNNLPILLNRFVNYVNCFRNEKIVNNKLKDLYMRLYLKLNSNQDINQLEEYMKYNKSLNNWILKNQNYNRDNLFSTLLQILSEELIVYYLDTEAIIGKLIKKTGVADTEIKKLFTNDTVDLNLVPKELKDFCVLEKIKDKKLSGIKIFLYMAKCLKDDSKENDTEFKKIHSYLTKNTTEINKIRLVKNKKLTNILTNLKDGSCDISDLKTLIKIYEKKIIKDINLDAEIKLIKGIINKKINTSIIQKYIYNLLQTISPDNNQLDLPTLVGPFLRTKTTNSLWNNKWNILLSAGIGLSLGGLSLGGLGGLAGLGISGLGVSTSTIISEIKNSLSGNISFDDFKNFINEEQNKSFNPHLNNVNTFRVYQYINFDSIIIRLDTLDKIMVDLSNNVYNEKNFKILKIVLEKHNNQLKQINKNISPKLEYILDKKWSLMKSTLEYINQLYISLLESADQNILLLNGLDFLKEQGILQTDENTYQNEKIINMFEIFNTNNISNITNTLDLIKDGMCDNTKILELKDLKNLIESSGSYISESQAIKIFFASHKDNEMEYDAQQELYQILVELAKTSTIVSEITTQVVQVATDAITDAVNTKLQAVALDIGFEQIPEDAIAKVQEIASTAKTIALTAGVGFATLGAYKAVDAIFGTESNSTQNSSLIAYEESSLKAKIQALVVSVGATLTLQSAQTLFPSIMSIVNDYIGFQSDKAGLPTPSFIPSVIGGIIMGGLTMGLQGQLEMAGGGQTDSKSLVERILDWIFASVDKLFGFNGAKPDPIIEQTQTQTQTQTQINTQTYTKSIESTYLYLTSQQLGSDDIFDGLAINEHPAQEQIYKELKQKYNDFNSTHFNFNPYFKLNKSDSKRIKKLIAKIIALELNLLKGSNPYTFVNALSRFLGE